MKQNLFGNKLVPFFVIVGALLVIGLIGEASEPSCIKTGCDNKQTRGSSYCYLHEPYTGSSTSHSSSSYSNKSYGSTSKSSTSSNYSNKSNSTNKSSYSSGIKKNTTTSRSTYDSYDDIYMDGDYDYDRYDRDSDYADGVDAAMDELGEDW
mgnify:CR=1 FL=1